MIGIIFPKAEYFISNSREDNEGLASFLIVVSYPLP